MKIDDKQKRWKYFAAWQPKLTYKNKNLRIRLCVKIYKTFPVNGSMTGNR